MTLLPAYFSGPRPRHLFLNSGRELGSAFAQRILMLTWELAGA